MDFPNRNIFPEYIDDYNPKGCLNFGPCQNPSIEIDESGKCTLSYDDRNTRVSEVLNVLAKEELEDLKNKANVVVRLQKFGYQISLDVLQDSNKLEKLIDNIEHPTTQCLVNHINRVCPQTKERLELVHLLKPLLFDLKKQ
jgi:hypothetical protein